MGAKTELPEETAVVVSRNQLTEKRFNELDTILASDTESRNLLRAKNLISELKKNVTGDHPRRKELAMAEQWVNESLSYRENMKSLEAQTRMLRTEIAKHKEALEQVRRTLVSE